MSVPEVRCIIVVLFLAAACGGHVNGANPSSSFGGSGGGGAALGGAGSNAIDAGGVASGGDGTTVGNVGDSGVIAACPSLNSSLSDYSALDGHGCTNVGVDCSRDDCTVDCKCESRGGLPTWRCVNSFGACGGPPK